MKCYEELRYEADQRSAREAKANSTRNTCLGYTRSLASFRDVPLDTLKPITLESAGMASSAMTLNRCRSAMSTTGRGKTLGTFSAAVSGSITGSTEMSSSRTIKPSLQSINHDLRTMPSKQESDALDGFPSPSLTPVLFSEGSL